MSKNVLLIFVSSIIAALVGSATTLYVLKSSIPNQQTLIRDFYLTENAVHVSPHTLRKKMDKGEKNFILVDLRSSEEYEKSHIVSAINVPAYIDPNTSISLEKENAEKERIIQTFRNLPKGTEIIVYCYSMPCMTGRKIGKLLSENGIFVKHLGIGWNEWRYYWSLWNHDGETPTNYQNYIVSGKDPGEPKIKDFPSPCGAGELGC